MKLSATKHAAVSFVAVLALGAATIFGCTVTSSTSGDTDGGKSSSSSSSGSTSSSSSGSSSGSTTSSSSGSTGDGGATCEGNKQTDFYPAACQSCLEAHCCNELKGCFNIDPGDAGDQVGCSAYSDCVVHCQETADGGDPSSCVKDQCDSVAAPGVADAFKQLSQCQQTSCATECQ